VHAAACNQTFVLLLLVYVLWSLLGRSNTLLPDSRQQPGELPVEHDSCTQWALFKA
jgi:hypothetical protein